GATSNDDGTVTCTTDGSAADLVEASGGDADIDAMALATTNLAGGADGTLADTSNFCVNNVAGGLTVGDAIQLTAASGTVYTRLTSVTPSVPLCGADGVILETPLATGNAVAAAGTVTEVNPYAFVKNVKIMDTESMNALAGPLTNASQGTSSNAATTTYTYTFPDDYDLFGAETRDLAIVADIDQTMPAGYRLRATVTYLDDYIKDIEANESLAATEVIGSPLAGNFMSIEDNTLIVARSSSPISQSYVLGQNDVNALGISLQAGDAGAVEVRKLIVRAYGDDGGTEFDDANGDGSANLLVSSVS